MSYLCCMKKHIRKNKKLTYLRKKIRISRMQIKNGEGAVKCVETLWL